MNICIQSRHSFITWDNNCARSGDGLPRQESCTDNRGLSRPNWPDPKEYRTIYLRVGFGVGAGVSRRRSTLSASRLRNYKSFYFGFTFIDVSILDISTRQQTLEFSVLPHLTYSCSKDGFMPFPRVKWMKNLDQNLKLARWIHFPHQ